MTALHTELLRRALNVKQSKLLTAVFPILLTMNFLEPNGFLLSVIIFTEEWRTAAKTSNHVITQQLLFATSGNLPCKHSAFICAQVFSYCSACSPQNLFPSLLFAVTSSLFDLALRWDRLVKLQGERVCFVLSLSSSRAKYYHMAQLPHLICWCSWAF